MAAGQGLERRGFARGFSGRLWPVCILNCRNAHPHAGSVDFFRSSAPVVNAIARFFNSKLDGEGGIAGLSFSIPFVSANMVHAVIGTGDIAANLGISNRR